MRLTLIDQRDLHRRRRAEMEAIQETIEGIQQKIAKAKPRVLTPAQNHEVVRHGGLRPNRRDFSDSPRYVELAKQYGA